MNEMMQACLLAASRIVEAEKAIYSNVQAFALGGSQGSEQSDFLRKGTSIQQKDYNLPSGIASLINQNATSSAVPTALSNQQISFLSGLLSMVAEAVPGLSVLQDTMTIDPEGFAGRGTLETIANKNPYSGDYEGETQALYERGMDTARSRAVSGPTNVRGGQARQGFDLADTNTQAGINRFREVSGVQRADAGMATQAAQVAQMIENMRRGTAMQAQQSIQAGESDRRNAGLQTGQTINTQRGLSAANVATAAEFLGKPKSTTTDDLYGKGNQSSNSLGWGLTCCFIFNAAHGEGLPWFVRFCRDHLGTEETRRGYIRMSRWLVPAMARFPLVRTLVQATMTYPMTRYGGYLVRENGYEDGFVFRPVKRFWFFVWNKLGAK